MTLDKHRLRSDFLGTQVITRNSGRRLGIISQVWVDVDQREVVAVGLQNNVLSGMVNNFQQVMMLTSIRQIGDVILVDDDTVLEDEAAVNPYSTLINCEVITEAGEPLGRVRGFKFDVTNGQLESIVVASFGLPQIPDQVISTYELPIDEVVSSGPDRLIVFEGAEEKMVQISVGLMERLGIGSPPWERGDENEYIMPVSTANQLPSGVQTPADFSRNRAPAAEERWSDDDWNGRERVEEPVPLQQQPVEQYKAAALEESNWNDEPAPQEYAPQEYAPPQDYAPVEADYKEVTEDVWSDDEPSPEPYQAPPINISQKKKVTEYEEELDY